MGALPLDFQPFRARAASVLLPKKAETLALTWPELEAALPDGGLPCGVVELSAARALGGATTIATCAVRAAQTRTPEAWCAWIDSGATLHAPGLATRGVDLARLFVVRPARKDLQRVAIKCAQSGAFDAIVVDVDPIGESGARKKNDALFVRKLAIAAEKSGATVILIVDSRAHKFEPWPVALRIELEREPSALFVRIGKDRHGRANPAKTRLRMEIFHGC